MSYPGHICFSKKIYYDFKLPGPGYTWPRVYPKFKKSHLVYTRYIFSCHMPYLSMSYPWHKFAMLSCSGLQMKFSRKLHCGSSSAYHCTVFIKHNTIYHVLPLVHPRATLPALVGSPSRGPHAGAPPTKGPPEQGVMEDRCNEF